MSGRPISAAGAAATAAAVLAVIAGLITLGSPSRARDRRLDQLRIDDLAQLSAFIDGYWRKHAALPPSTDSLVAARDLDHVPSDPKTGTPYTYLASGERSYRLCATFALPSDSNAARSYSYDPMVLNVGGSGMPIAQVPHSWRHGAGESCFDLTPPPKDAK
jgi:hypothetical protein